MGGCGTVSRYNCRSDSPNSGSLSRCIGHIHLPRFEWGYEPDTLKQQDRWQKFSTGELNLLKQALATADDEPMLDDIGVEILHQIEGAIRRRTTD
jgi:hypothetical protein